MNQDEKKKGISLNWEEFRALGNPDNVAPEEKEVNSDENYEFDILIYKQRKGRKGKTVTLIKGIDLPLEQLKAISKELKQYCGVGGNIEGEEIMLQGDQRTKAEKYLSTKYLGKVKVGN